MFEKAVQMKKEREAKKQKAATIFRCCHQYFW